jgi:hypothetical protein
MATRVQWKDDEWMAVCEQLFQNHPIECRSSTLMGIKDYDVFAAMKKALSPDRWRVSMNMTQTRPTLLANLKIIIKSYDRRSHDEAQKQQELSQKNDVKSVLAPLAELMAKEVFEHLKPMLDEYIQLAMGHTDKSPSDAVVSHHRGTTPRKTKVGVIGMLPIQGNELEMQFPQFEFKFVEDGKKTDEVKAISTCDAIFGMTQKMSHNAETVLKRTPGWERYHRVAGRGATSIKRAIQGWMTS